MNKPHLTLCLFAAALVLLALSPNAMASATEPMEPLEPIATVTLGGDTPLTLEEVARSALDRYPGLLAAADDIDAANGKLLSAQGAFDLTLKGKLYDAPVGFYDITRYNVWLEQPTPVWGLELRAGYRRGVGNFPEYYGQYETLRGGELRVELNLPLLKGGADDERRLKIRLSELKVAQSEAKFQAKALILWQKAAEAYWMWRAAGEKVRVSRRLLELAEAREAAVETLIKQGAVPAVERLESRRAVLSRRGSLIKAHRKLEKAAIKLSLYLRDSQGQPIMPRSERMPDVLNPPAPLTAEEISQAHQDALERRPEMENIRLGLDGAEAEVELARNNVLPELDIEVGSSWDTGDQNEGQYKKLGDPVVEWGVSLKFPLQMRKARGELEAAQARRSAATHDAALAQDTLLTQVDDAISAWEAALDGLEAAAAGADISEQNAAAERRRFLLGVTDLFKVNLLEDYAAQAENKRIEALMELHIARATFQAVVARPSFAP